MSSTLSTSKKLDISGIYPPIVTSFNEKHEICLDKIRENIRKWNEIPFAGIVVLGSNGEAVMLNEQEKLQLITTVVSELKQLGSKKLVVAGTGADSTKQTIALTNKAAEAGAHVALIMTPYFFKSEMKAEALEKHFIEVANASKIPVIIYNVSKFTGVEISAESVIRLAAHPNIIGLKDSDGNITKLSKIAAETAKHGFQVLAGSASFLYPTMLVGGVGGVCALANIAGRECCDVIRLVKQNKLEEAKILQARLIDPNTAVTSQFGVAGLKAALELIGMYGGPVRAPLQPLSSAAHTQLKQILHKANIINTTVPSRL